MDAFTALRLDGYIRVSDVRGRAGPSFISPSVQREQIDAWCAIRGAKLLNVAEELDASGRRADRPKLQELIGRVEAGVSDGIIVAKLDRFGRSLRDALDHLDRIQRAGGTFVSVQEGFDLSTEHGRLVLRLMLSYAEFDSDRIRASWDDARRRAVARGVHGSGVAPVGYRRRADGRLRPHPKTAPAVREAFALRARGASLDAAGQILRDGKIRSARGGSLWTRTTMALLFKNRVYLGEARCGTYILADAHNALVDPVTWRLAQSLRRKFLGLGPDADERG
ncbi:integrase [Baekduia alba]|uniref:recombinase family protein n=1 Tax=Baekduia alba TaxID=2997333 RepID=UPI002340161E|nr:recombinase family protein [Baekduia alba]WCB96516.1 integrase [Baekduia alba]